MNKQEAIEEIKDLYNFVMEDGPFEVDLINKNQAIGIISQIDEPQKPVVPKFVAEWIDELKKSHSNLAWVWQVYPNEPKVKNWLESNTEKFMRAWLDGYEVEQEKLYTVQIPNPKGSGYSKIYLAKNKDGEVEFFTWSGYTSIEFADDWKQEDNAQLTESEIKQDFDFLWQFAKEVEEN